MCGVAGVLGPPKKSDEARGAALAEAAYRLGHRGPDRTRTWSGNRVELAHTRLAIIDIEGGDQPMFTADQRYAVVFNGEIYNHRDLRRELEAEGYRFQTHCDTEVLLHLYAWLGAAMVDRLRGMFAFCVVDLVGGCALLARDRLGKKPLYYSQHDGALAFASTLDALLPLLPSSPGLDADGIARYLALQYVPSPLTPYQGVYKLPPGHSIEWSTNGASVSRYWQLPTRAGEDPEARSASALEVRSQISEAVALRLESEVPLGVFLSGGLDSSAVVAELASLGIRPSTFSMGFRSVDHDETAYADLVARHFSTRHTELTADDDVPGLFRHLTELYDEPFADSSALATLAVAKAASDHVTVVLTGDGGDELFGGYGRYLSYRRSMRLRKRFGPFADVVAAVSSRVGQALNVRKARAVGLHLRSPWLAYRNGMFHFRPDEVARLLQPEFARTVTASSAAEHLDELWAQVPDSASSLLWVDAQTYLPDDLLTKMDRATMAYGVEARSPLLDHRLVEWASSLPDAALFQGPQGKMVFRNAYQGVLPPEILTRGKMGFGVPIGSWMRNELRPIVGELLLSDEGPLRNLLRPDVVRSLARQSLAARSELDTRAWNLLALAGWMRARSLG